MIAGAGRASIMERHALTVSGYPTSSSGLGGAQMTGRYMVAMDA